MQIIEFREITKVFGSRTVLDKVSFSIKKGEVHALLGENGAGKSTLMNILFGLTGPDSGEVWINGKKNTKGLRSEIGMVHQHFMLVETMSVLENIILARGAQTNNKLVLLENEQKKLNQELKALDLNLMVNLNEKIKNMSVGSQQKIEIIKMLLGNGSILIFDEPTAMLTPIEIVEFENLVKQLKMQGKTILIITHKLSEIIKMADRCSIIRKGEYIATVDVNTTNEHELAELMVGRAIRLTLLKEPLLSSSMKLPSRVLELRNGRTQKIGPLNFYAKAGEILGIAGVDGNGQGDLARLLYGLIPLESGEYYLNNIKLAELTPANLHHLGVRYIPEDRQHTGLVLDFSVEENLVLHCISQMQFSKGFLINWHKIRTYAKYLIEKFDIRPNDPTTIVKNLSGGNQQKVILARELNEIPKVVIAYQPTRGLDVGAIEFIHQQLLNLRKLGVAVILISYELDELLSLSDRIAVIFQGQIVAQEQGPYFNKDWIGEAMMGVIKNGGEIS